MSNVVALFPESSEQEQEQEQDRLDSPGAPGLLVIEGGKSTSCGRAGGPLDSPATPWVALALIGAVAVVPQVAAVLALVGVGVLVTCLALG